ncbi:multicopper oxidase domain-containing protein, partial [Dysgonomonas sp. ZJ709]|uniref:multicopper oxidase domain-containing protein n=1 Tax=Dysgonomonas sp. ZJ709 TaxID=2709797 RepID=UPI0013EDB2E2
MKWYLLIVLFFAVSMGGYSQKLVHYDLYINDTIVNYTGKNKKAIAVNGQIPMPTLYFTEGDTAVVYV